MTTAVNSPAHGPAAVAANSALIEAEMIPVWRGQIDALDEAIIALVVERARISRRIQTARMNAGGTRVELARERVVRGTYRAGVGGEGAHLADALLDVCRGSR